MKEGWEVENLTDICQIKPPKQEARQHLQMSDLVSFVPMNNLGINTKILLLDTKKPLAEVIRGYTYFAENDVLLAKITPCFENGKLGIARGLTNKVGFGSSEFIVLRSKGRIDPEYLYYYLSQQQIRSNGARVMTGAVGHKRVPNEFINNLEIPLPPLAEQKRIVAILDEAFEGIAAMTANAEKNLANAREMFESKVIHNFFGNPNDKKWHSANVDQLVLTEKGSIRTGPFGSQLLHGEFVHKGIAVLGIDNAVLNEFRWDKRRFITEKKYNELKRYTVKPGDVLSLFAISYG